MLRNGNMTLVGELRGLKPQRLTADPVARDMRVGLIWVNTTEQSLKWFDGTSVHTLAHGGSLDDYLTLSGGTLTGPLELAAEAVEPLEPVSLSQLQTQLAEKQGNIEGAIVPYLDDKATIDRVVITDGLGNFTTAEISVEVLGYLEGTDRNIKEFIETKQDNIGYVPVNQAGDALEGDLDMGGLHTIVNSRKPVEPTDVVRLIDIENLKADLDFQADVLFVQKDATVTTAVIDALGLLTHECRIIVTDLATLDSSFGTIAGLARNDIIQRNADGTYKVAYAVGNLDEGVLTWVRDLSKFMKYNGAEWSEHGGLSGVTPTSGLFKEDNTIGIKVGAALRLTSSGALGVKVRTAGALKVIDPTSQEESDADTSVLALRHNDQFVVAAEGLELAASAIVPKNLAEEVVGAGLQGAAGSALSVKNADASIVVDEDGVKLGDVSEKYLAFNVGGILTAPVSVMPPLYGANPVPLAYHNATEQRLDKARQHTEQRFEQSQYIYNGLSDTAQIAYNIPHNFGNQGVIVAVYGEDMKQILPDSVELVDENTVSVTLANAQRVYVVVQGLKVSVPIPPVIVVTPENVSFTQTATKLEIVVDVSSVPNAYQLEMDNSLEPTLPQFTLYTGSTPLEVWSSEEAVQSATSAGVEATHDNGVWTLTLNEGAALSLVNGSGATFYMVVKDSVGNATGSMSGGKSLRVVIPAFEAPLP